MTIQQTNDQAQPDDQQCNLSKAAKFRFLRGRAVESKYMRPAPVEPVGAPCRNRNLANCLVKMNWSENVWTKVSDLLREPGGLSGKNILEGEGPALTVEPDCPVRLAERVGRDAGVHSLVLWLEISDVQPHHDLRSKTLQVFLFGPFPAFRGRPRVLFQHFRHNWPTSTCWKTHWKKNLRIQFHHVEPPPKQPGHK